jgi:hypothetical protein
MTMVFWREVERNLVRRGSSPSPPLLSPFEEAWEHAMGAPTTSPPPNNAAANDTEVPKGAAMRLNA